MRHGWVLLPWVVCWLAGTGDRAAAQSAHEEEPLLQACVQEVQPIARASIAINAVGEAEDVGDLTIMWRHVLPNAMVSTLTFMPFILNGSITTLTSLDFLGFGLPSGSPSLGELALQGKNNPQAPWLGLSAFFVLALMLSLLVFIGEAVRDAFDPRKVFTTDGGR